MELTQKQEEAIRDKSRYKVLNWGRRSGKTTEFGYEALGTALSVNEAKITYYAQTFDDARTIAWDIFLQIFGPAVSKKNDSRLEITVKNIHGGYSKVSLKGWESVVTADKGRGSENDLLMCDEVAFCRGFLEKWDTVLEPTLLTTRGRAVFGSTPNGFNDFYTLHNTAQSDPEWYYSHATSYDNPANDIEWLDKKKSSMPEDRFAQEYMADFRKMEGLVYKEFSRNLHIFGDEELKRLEGETCEYIAGVDFGFTNPFACIAVKKDKRGVYWVVNEDYETGKTDAQIAEIVAARNFTKVYPDPENPGAIKELVNRQVNCCEVIKGDGSITSGVSKIRELLKQRRLKVHKSCINLIWEFETYHYPKKKAIGNEPEKPVKENDHALDALRYLILMDANIQEIKQYDTWIRKISYENKPQTNPAI
ncbi:MAG: terminase large subunit [Patescibacteria group bacterium]